MKTGICEPVKVTSFSTKKTEIIKKFKDCKILLLMVMPTMVYFIIFHYKPMWGVLIAFKDYSVFNGFSASPWAGFKYFKLFFSNPDAWKLIKNTVLLSFYSILWGFPAPIIFSLVLNEVKNLKAKKIVQTLSYMPHFISTVVLVGMVTMFLSPTTGVLNNFLDFMGFQRVNFLANARYFRTIYVASGIWQGLGWSSIIYLAAISNIDPQLYESSVIDGANKLKQVLHITLPCIAPTMITLFLLNLGNIMNLGFEKVFLLQKPVIYDTADVISTFVYRQGIKQGNFSYATAVGLFNSAINVLFLIGANMIAQRTSETSLW